MILHIIEMLCVSLPGQTIGVRCFIKFIKDEPLQINISKIYVRVTDENFIRKAISLSITRSKYPNKSFSAYHQS